MDARIDLCLKDNLLNSRGPCALCGTLVAPDGIAFFVEGSQEIVCRACGAAEAPELYALLAPAQSDLPVLQAAA